MSSARESMEANHEGRLIPRGSSSMLNKHMDAYSMWHTVRLPTACTHARTHAYGWIQHVTHASPLQEYGLVPPSM